MKNKIKALRHDLNMTVRNLANKSGVAVGYISEIENDNNDKTNPTMETMVKISTALGKTVQEIFFPNEI